MMNEQQVKQAVDEINAYLQRQPWCDFEVMEYQGDTLIIMGSLDTTAPHDVEVQFKGISFLSLPMEWKTDTAAPPLAVVQGEDACRLNGRFQVEQGHHLFGFRPEGYPEGFSCLICAREISYKPTKPSS
jgi:hypothetical protein